MLTVCSSWYDKFVYAQSPKAYTRSEASLNPRKAVVRTKTKKRQKKTFSGWLLYQTQSYFRHKTSQLHSAYFC